MGAPTSGAPPGPSAPSTGSEHFVLEADAITGKVDNEAIATGEWPDQSPHNRTVSKAGSGTYVWRENLGVNGGSCVEFDDATGFNISFGGGTDNIEVGDTYVLFAIVRVIGIVEHVDNLLYGAGTNTRDAVMYYNFTGLDKWRIYNGGSHTTDTIANGVAFFDNWGLLKIHNDRTASSFVAYNGTTLHTMQLSTFEISDFPFPGSIQRRVELLVYLKNPSAQDVTDWETYLNEKYGVTV